MRMTAMLATRGSAPSARTWTLNLPHLMLPESIRVGCSPTNSPVSETARPGSVALLDYARPGDTVVVAAIDRLGRSVAEVTRTIADLGERRITLHVLREGVDTATPTGRAIAAIMASLAELESELGRERRAASRESRRARHLPATKPLEAQPRTARTVAPACCDRGACASTGRSVRNRTSNCIPLSLLFPNLKRPEWLLASARLMKSLICPHSAASSCP